MNLVTGVARLSVEEARIVDDLILVTFEVLAQNQDGSPILDRDGNPKKTLIVCDWPASSPMVNVLDKAMPGDLCYLAATRVEAKSEELPEGGYIDFLVFHAPRVNLIERDWGGTLQGMAVGFVGRDAKNFTQEKYGKESTVGSLPVDYRTGPNREDKTTTWYNWKVNSSLKPKPGQTQTAAQNALQLLTKGASVGMVGYVGVRSYDTRGEVVEHRVQPDLNVLNWQFVGRKPGEVGSAPTEAIDVPDIEEIGF